MKQIPLLLGEGIPSPNLYPLLYLCWLGYYSDAEKELMRVTSGSPEQITKLLIFLKSKEYLSQMIQVQVKLKSANTICKEIQIFISPGLVDIFQGALNTQTLKPKKQVKDYGISLWIDEYRELFKGKKTGAMGSKLSCTMNMSKFWETCPGFQDKELILFATRRYIASTANSNYKYMMEADNFISKDGKSKLEAVCSEVIDMYKARLQPGTGTPPSNISESSGRSVL